MTISDLKVTEARVTADNSNQADRVMNIQATFVTTANTLQRVESGQVTKEGVFLASFWTGMTSENATSVTFHNDAHDNTELQCELITFINEFLEVATAKVAEEANE